MYSPGTYPLQFSVGGNEKYWCPEPTGMVTLDWEIRTEGTLSSGHTHPSTASITLTWVVGEREWFVAQ